MEPKGKRLMRVRVEELANKGRSDVDDPKGSRTENDRTMPRGPIHGAKPFARKEKSSRSESVP